MTELCVADRQISQSADGLYSLNDLHLAAGGGDLHKPSNFLRLDSTQELVLEISNCPDLSNSPVRSAPGRYGGTFVCKELVYAYAMWVSPKFHLQVIRAYDALVTRATEPSDSLSTIAAIRGTDITVSAARSFAAIVRVCRMAGAGRARSLRQANADTIRVYGVDLLARCNVDDLLLPAAEAAADPQSNVSMFCHALMEGDLGIELRPALSTDVMAIYSAWCARNGWRGYPMHKVISTLVRNFYVRSSRKRYIDGCTVRGPHSFLALDGNTNPPRDADERTWLGEQAEAFRQSAAEYIDQP